jgi:hypothetical protein
VRRKVLQDLANALCDMLVGWRMGEDLERIAALPDGALEFDLIANQAAHTVAGPIDLWMCGELSTWLRSRFVELKLPFDSLQTATLRADFRTDRIATNRKKIISFDWECRSRLVTDEKEYVGQLTDKHVWHTRLPPNKSLKRTREG